VLFPVVWIALASIKTPEQLNDPFLLSSPRRWTVAQRAVVGHLAAAGRSAIVALACVAISVVVGSMAAYAIARYRAGGTATDSDARRPGASARGAGVPVPHHGLRPAAHDHPGPVISAHLSFVCVSPGSVRVLRGSPQSLEEQAQVDGFTRFQAFRPSSSPRCSPAWGPRPIFGFTCPGTTSSTG